MRVRLVGALQERERMTPEALRTQAVADLQKKVDKIRALEEAAKNLGRARPPTEEP